METVTVAEEKQRQQDEEMMGLNQLEDLLDEQEEESKEETRMNAAIAGGLLNFVMFYVVTVFISQMIFSCFSKQQTGSRYQN